MKYDVTWTTAIEADTPEEAVRKAWHRMRGLTSPEFHVTTARSGTTFWTYETLADTAVRNA